MLDIIVRPHDRHLALERLERELERRARVPDFELLQHTRVQDAQPSYGRVLLASARAARFPPRTGLLI
jgi:hypothetical protein